MSVTVKAAWITGILALVGGIVIALLQGETKKNTASASGGGNTVLMQDLNGSTVVINPPKDGAAQSEQVEKASPLRWSQLTLATDLCLWEKSGELEWHQEPVFTWSQERKDADQRIDDPVFDITLLNPSSAPVVLSEIGIVPISFHSTVKGIPITGKIRRFDSYELAIPDFVPGKSIPLELKPVYIRPGDPYRMKLRLKGYRKAVPGNESTMKLYIIAGMERIESQDIYLGLF